MRAATAQSTQKNNTISLTGLYIPPHLALWGHLRANTATHRVYGCRVATHIPRMPPLASTNYRRTCLPQLPSPPLCMP